MTESKESKISRRERADALGLAFLRTMILLNGGAIISMLTFLGSSSAQTTLTIELGAIKSAMLLFLGAICTVLLSLVISYSFTATAPGNPYADFWNKHIVKLNTLAGTITVAGFVAGVIVLIEGFTLK